jgi:NAD+ synthase
LKIFGVGFYKKYGDGGVDISPTQNYLKTQVWEMGKELKILESIIKASPTDGLWTDGRIDERQLGMSYEDLDKAMLNTKDKNYEKYLKIRKRNPHKMNQIPICKLNNDE